MKTTSQKIALLFLLVHWLFMPMLYAQDAQKATAQETCTGKCPSIRGGAIDSKTFIAAVSKRKSKIALTPYHDKAGGYSIVAWTYNKSRSGPRELEADLPLITNCGPCLEIPAGDTLGFWMLTPKQVKALCDTLKKRKDYTGIVFVPVAKTIRSREGAAEQKVVSWAVIPLKENTKDVCIKLSFMFNMGENILVGDANPCPPCNTKRGGIK